MNLAETFELYIITTTDVYTIFNVTITMPVVSVGTRSLLYSLENLRDVDEFQ